MKSVETSWNSQDNLKFFGQYWAPEGETKAVVCLVHGLGEHSGRYDHVGEFLNQNGIALYGMDHRGHGKTEGKRGHIPSLEIVLDDVSRLLEQAAKQFPDVPQFIYGHSMGGNIGLNFLMRKTPAVKGAIITGPWLRLPDEPGPMKVLMAKVMNLFYPSYQDSNNLDPKGLSHNTDVVQAYIDDPLVHDKISVHSFLELSASATWALENASKLSIPTLLMHGTDDVFTSAPASEEFAKSAGKIVDLKLWDGYFHEIHNEVKNGLVFAAMLEWLNGKM